MWWDPDTIERTVTREFVCSHLLPDEIERLDRPLGFGDGLTDGTYWEWIDEKSKRIFLILVDLGVPDQIFGVIDDSWDDEDLPIAFDQVERLALTAEKDERIEKRFYQRQFYYLLRPLLRGEHAVYQDNEVIPLDVVDRKQGAQNHPVDKVVLPNYPGTVFCRRRIPLGSTFGQGYMSQEDFLYEVNSIRNVQNDHLISYWSSYIHQGYGHVLFTPATDFTLKSFLTTTPSSIKNLDKHEMRRLVMNWIHCLIDTLCFLHNRGLSHGNIKPSTILFTNDNQIYIADFTVFNNELMMGVEKNSFDKEAYDYAAPEQWFRPTSGPPSPTHRRATLSTLSTSPENNHNFTISRSWTDYGSNTPHAMMHAPTPHLNPQAADVFSVGCVILELLSFLLKKQGRPFATYRAAKHITPGRGGAIPDASFHKNLGQVEVWMTQLAKDASKKDDQVFRGMAPMLHVVERMLALHPSERPAAQDVQTRMYKILTEFSGISEPHCVHQYGGWDFGIGSLKLDSPSLARNNSYDTMSIATKRSSGSGGSIDHRRISGSSGGSVRRTMSISQESTREPQRNSRIGHDLGSGLRAIQNLRIRDKVRPWQSPVYAGNERISPADGPTEED
ncbi:kinase domain-containing protein [Lasiosphaeris hirsuta]|uniref:Kinase domain-containing protein n=1 Tax=Lasiosphaeris hirsuta TaxID=260670 RepID=A0AA40DL20_9PEZI|nr:kinase domain-containing protein [Lasiosphaeris hirsuta]